MSCATRSRSSRAVGSSPGGRPDSSSARSGWARSSLSWRNELLAVWAVTLRNALMGARNVFFFFELLFWPIVGVLSIGLMSRFLDLTEAQASFVLVGTIALSVVAVCL